MDLGFFIIRDVPLIFPRYTRRDKRLTGVVVVSPGVVTVNSFLKDLDSLNTSLLIAVQRLAKIAEERSSKDPGEDATADSGSMLLVKVFKYRSYKLN